MSRDLATSPRALDAALSDLPPEADAAAMLGRLLRQGLDRLPLPGAGATLQRWRCLAAVARRDLSLVKLYEGHVDALAILAELGAGALVAPGMRLGTWAAEAPEGRVRIETPGDDKGVDGATRVATPSLRVVGRKCWCSGASHLTHGLMTAWPADGRGPQLVLVELAQPGVAVDRSPWQALGMAGSGSVDVVFSGAAAVPVGGLGAYLQRPGFWQGGAGIAACWHGGAEALGEALHRALAERSGPPQPFKLAALGKVDLALQQTAAVLRDAAAWIDAHPQDDASSVALRARLSAEDSARRVLEAAGAALGAGAFCRDARFARAAADLPVFVRQSHGEQDFAALGERRLAAARADPWRL